MNQQNAHRFAEITRMMVREVIRSRMPEDAKMDKLGKIFALYGYHAQAIGYAEACNAILEKQKQEGKK